VSNHFIYLDPSPQATGDGPLTGKRIAVQSNVAVQGWPTAAGSLALENYTALEDATAVARIRASLSGAAGSANWGSVSGTTPERPFYGTKARMPCS